MKKEGHVARFELFFYCNCCMSNVSSILDVPNVEDAPRDVEELAESALLRRQRFVCERCDGAIGTLVGISRRAMEAHS